MTNRSLHQVQHAILYTRHTRFRHFPPRTPRYQDCIARHCSIPSNTYSGRQPCRRPWLAHAPDTFTTQTQPIGRSRRPPSLQFFRWPRSKSRNASQQVETSLVDCSGGVAVCETTSPTTYAWWPDLQRRLQSVCAGVFASSRSSKSGSCARRARQAPHARTRRSSAFSRLLPRRLASTRVVGR